MDHGQEVVVCKNCGSNAVTPSINTNKMAKIFLVAGILFLVTVVLFPLGIIMLVAFFFFRRYRYTPYVFKCQSCRKEIFVDEHTFQRYNQEVR